MDVRYTIVDFLCEYKTLISIKKLTLKKIIVLHTK